MSKVISALVVTLAVALAIPACGKKDDKAAAGGDKPAATADAGAGADGKAVYDKTCAVCHGADGAGTPASTGKGFKTPEFKAKSEGEVKKIVSDGTGNGMQAFKDTLKGDELNAVVKYIMSM